MWHKRRGGMFCSDPELRRADEILKAAAVFFGAELDRHSKR